METSGAEPWFFDRWSSFYDEEIVQRLVYRPVHDAVLSVLSRASPARVLDLGCGTGLLTARLKDELHVADLTGADFSEGMLGQAAARRRDIRWVKASASALPFADESFDAITSTEAFHWFPDQSLALRECRRVLAPGGRLVVALVHPWSGWVSRAAFGASTLVGQPLWWPTLDEMREMLEGAGFEVEKQARILRLGGLLLFPPALSLAVRR